MTAAFDNAASGAAGDPQGPRIIVSDYLDTIRTPTKRNWELLKLLERARREGYKIIVASSSFLESVTKALEFCRKFSMVDAGFTFDPDEEFVILSKDDLSPYLASLGGRVLMVFDNDPVEYLNPSEYDRAVRITNLQPDGTTYEELAQELGLPPEEAAPQDEPGGTDP